MDENKNFDMDFIIDELSSRLEDMLEDALVDQVDYAIEEAVSEAIGEVFSNFEFVLKDGTVVRAKQKTKVLSPDKSKLLICYGGLRVDGCSLLIQTRVSCWEGIAYYKTREEAIEALTKVKNAIESGISFFEL